MPWVLAVLLTWTAFSLRGAAPGIVGGDAPELTAAAFHLGPAHAPGYPFFILFGKIFESLPLGTPAFRLTFFSILIQGLALWVTVKTLEDFLSRNGEPGYPRGIALLTGALVFSGPLIFHQTLSPEVFALHLLFVALLLRMVLFPSPQKMFLAFFIMGLALTHQHLALLVLPSLGLAFWPHQTGKKNILALSFVFLALSPYLVLPLRAALSPEVNWGTPSTFQAFWHGLTRAQYGGDLAGGSFYNGLSDLLFFGRKLLEENWGAGFALFALGFWRNRGRFSAAYGVGIFALFFILPFLIRTPTNPENNFVAQAFLPPALLWISPGIALGLNWIFQRVGSLRKGLWTLLALLILGNMFWGLRRCDSSRNLAVEDMARNFLKQMPSHSVLYSEGDAVTFPLAYCKLVLGIRPDAEVFDRTEGLFPAIYKPVDSPEGPNPILQVGLELEREKTHAPSAVFYSESDSAPSRVLQRTGLLFQVLGGSFFPPPDSVPLWAEFCPPRVSSTGDYLSEETAARFHLFKASYDFDVAKNSPAALEDLSQAASVAPDNCRVLVNAGVLETDHGDTDQAVLLFEKACEINPAFYLAWYDLGVSAQQEGRLQDSMQDLQQAIHANPAYLDAHNRLAFEYYQQKNFQLAAQEWETARQLAPDSPDAYRNLGLLYTGTNPPYAKLLLEKYLALDPSAPNGEIIEKWLKTQAAVSFGGKGPY